MKPVQAALVVDCAPGELFRWVEDLSTYPRWLELVRRAEPVEGLAEQPGEATPPGSGEGPLLQPQPRWDVVLTASIGPLRRSKRLTMARTVHEQARRSRVRFERRESDGRPHAAWVLEADVGPHANGSELVMTLRYDGRWWGPLIEGLLAEQINAARPRLSSLASGGAGL